MFRKIDVRVTVGEHVTFEFAEPISITTVTIARPDTEEIFWDFINDAFKPVENAEGWFQSWPIDQAPEWALEALEQVSAREAARLASEGPHFPTIRSLTYGELPPGYREDIKAKPLTPGPYVLTLFAEQGNAGVSFEVPVA